MDKREYKLEKLKAQIASQRELRESAAEFLQNPLIEFALGILFIAWLTKDPDGRLEWWKAEDLARAFQAGGLGAALTAVISAQQLSKALPYITDTTTKLLPSLVGALR